MRVGASVVYVSEIVRAAFRRGQLKRFLTRVTPAESQRRHNGAYGRLTVIFYKQRGRRATGTLVGTLADYLTAALGSTTWRTPHFLRRRDLEK